VTKQSFLPLFLAFLCIGAVQGIFSTCPNASDPCMNDDNYMECKHLEADSSCEKVVASDSCPVKFTCVEKVERRYTRSLATYKCPKPNKTCKCGNGKYCISDWEYKSCLKLVKDGCKKVAYKSCPYKYYCKAW
jgi:hypothetical protein